MIKKFRFINQRMKKPLDILTVLIIWQTFSSSAEENIWRQNEVLLSNKIEHEKEGAGTATEVKGARLIRNVDGRKERFQENTYDKNLGRSSRSPESSLESNQSDYRCACVRIFYRSVNRYSNRF